MEGQDFPTDGQANLSPLILGVDPPCLGEWLDNPHQPQPPTIAPGAGGSGRDLPPVFRVWVGSSCAPPTQRLGLVTEP